MPPRKQFPLRVDPQLWEVIQRLAAADLRSVNSEVEFLLREAVERRTGQGQPGLSGDVGDGSGEIAGRGGAK